MITQPSLSVASPTLRTLHSRIFQSFLPSITAKKKHTSVKGRNLFQYEKIWFGIRFILGENRNVPGWASGFPGADVIHAPVVMGGENGAWLEVFQNVHRELTEK